MSQRFKEKPDMNQEKELIRVYKGNNLMHHLHVPKGVPDYVQYNMIIAELKKREAEAYQENLDKKVKLTP